MVSKQSQPDRELLRNYIEDGSHPAFARIVNRHIGMVYASARRRVSDSHLAEDVTQATFLVLARRAKSLPVDVHLGAWLLRVTQYTASNARRLEARRERYQRKAAQAMAMINHDQSAEPNDLWEEIAPHLDDAVLALRSADRRVVVLRYFENRSTSEMATILGISEPAARQRLSRAISKLRNVLTRHTGPKLGETALSGLLMTHALEKPAESLIASTISIHSAVPAAQVASISSGAVPMLVLSAGAKALAAVATAILIVGAGVGSVILTADGPSTRASTTMPMQAMVEPKVVSPNEHPVAAEMYRLLAAMRAYTQDHQQNGRPRWPSELADIQPYIAEPQIDLGRYLYTFDRGDPPDTATIAILEAHPEERAANAQFNGGQFLGIADGVVLYGPSLTWGRSRRTQPDLFMFPVYESDSERSWLSGISYTFPDPEDPQGRRRVALSRSILMSGPCFDSARAVPGKEGRFLVVLTVTNEYKPILAGHTREFKGRRIGLVLKEEQSAQLLAAPVITEILTDEVRLPLEYTKEDAIKLTLQINRVFQALR